MSSLGINPIILYGTFSSSKQEHDNDDIVNDDIDGNDIDNNPSNYNNTGFEEKITVIGVVLVVTSLL